MNQILGALFLMASEPLLWIFGTYFLLAPILFARGVVRRRSPPTAVLLVMGAVGGALMGVFDLTSSRDMFYAVKDGLTWAGFAWLWLAMPVTLAAVIQPGEPAPMHPSRAARHLLPALIGAVLIGSQQIEFAWLGMPVVVVSLCAGRASGRILAAWRTGAVLLVCEAALLGALYGFGSQRHASLLLAYSAWMSAHAVAVSLELQANGERGLERWIPLLMGLALLGGLVAGWR